MLGRGGRAVCLAFHPDFNIAGCQPSVVMPQVGPCMGLAKGNPAWV